MDRRKSIISTKENKYLGPIDEFISKNLGLANSITHTYTRYLEEFAGIIDIEDILQAAHIGLIKAYYTFDPINFTNDIGESLKFSTHAYSKMHGEIRSLFRDCNIGVKISRTIKEKISFFKKNGLNLNDNYELISKTTGWTLVEVREFILDVKMYNKISLDVKIDDFDITFIDNLSDINSKKNYYGIILSDFTGFLSLNQLEVYELIINQGLSQYETAKIIGVSQVQISRIFNQILTIGKHYGEGKFIPKKFDINNELRVIVEEFILQNNDNIKDLYKLLKEKGYTYQYNTIVQIFKRVKDSLNFTNSNKIKIN